MSELKGVFLLSVELTENEKGAGGREKIPGVQKMQTYHHRKLAISQLAIVHGKHWKPESGRGRIGGVASTH